MLYIYRLQILISTNKYMKKDKPNYKNKLYCLHKL